MHKLLYSFLFLIGLGIIWSIFFFMVPDEAKTNIAYLNVIIISLIYTCGWLGSAVLFPSMKGGKAGDRLIGTGIFWTAEGTYAGASILIMLLGAGCEWTFKTQLFLQIIALFFFVIGCANAIFAMEHASSCSKKDRATISRVRIIQDLISRISAQAALLPPECAGIKQTIRNIEEQTYYLSGIENPEVEALDDQIILHLRELQTMISQGQDRDAIQSKSQEIISLAVQRKIYKTIG